MIRAEIVPYSLPFVRPVRLGGRPFTARSGWLLRLEDSDGHAGWGEASPLPGFSRENTEAVWKDLERIVARVAAGDLHPAVTDTSSARFALELAQVNLEAARRSCSAAEVLSDQPRQEQSINGVLLADEPVQEAVSAARVGYKALKMKVGAHAVSADAYRVRSVWTAIQGAATLRLDANRAWSLREARAFAELIGDVELEYVEEPLSDPAELPALAQTGLPIALDESVGTLRLDDLSEMTWLKALVIKPTIVGGLRRSQVIAEKAIRSGITPVISSAVETGIGLRALAALAAGLGERDIPAGLDTARFLRGDVTDPEFVSAASVSVIAPEPFDVVV